MKYSPGLQHNINCGHYKQEVYDNIDIYNNATEMRMSWMKEWLHVSHIYAPAQAFNIPEEIAKQHGVSKRWLIVNIYMSTWIYNNKKVLGVIMNVISL